MRQLDGKYTSEDVDEIKKLTGTSGGCQAIDQHEQGHSINALIEVPSGMGS